MYVYGMESTPQENKYFCYIIASGSRTYNGYTVNLVRRLRQHNGELAGGARATSGKGPWRYISIMTAPSWTAVRAMQVEWSHKYPTRRRPRPREYQGAEGRIRSMEQVCRHVPEEVSLYVCDSLSSILGALPENIKLHSLSELFIQKNIQE